MLLNLETLPSESESNIVTIVIHVSEQASRSTGMKALVIQEKTEVNAIDMN